MKPKGPRIESFWNEIAAQRRRDRLRDDREFQRKVLLGADALVNRAGWDGKAILITADETDNIFAKFCRAVARLVGRQFQ